MDSAFSLFEKMETKKKKVILLDRYIEFPFFVVEKSPMSLGGI